MKRWHTQEYSMGEGIWNQLEEGRKTGERPNIGLELMSAPTSAVISVIEYGEELGGRYLESDIYIMAMYVFYKKRTLISREEDDISGNSLSFSSREERLENRPDLLKIKEIILKEVGNGEVRPEDHFMALSWLLKDEAGTQKERDEIYYEEARSMFKDVLDGIDPYRLRESNNEFRVDREKMLKLDEVLEWEMEIAREKEGEFDMSSIPNEAPYAPEIQEPDDMEL